MAANNNSLEIPEGWILDTRVKRDGTEVQGFLCPETGQQFATYHELRRYVTYAKAAKLSIYSPDSEFNKMKKGASSNSSISDQGEKRADSARCPTTQKPNPAVRSLGKSSTSKAKKKQPKRK